MKDVIVAALICATIAACVVGFFFAATEAGKTTMAYRTACMEQGGTIDGWSGNCIP